MAAIVKCPGKEDTQFIIMFSNIIIILIWLLCSCCHGYIGLSQETKDKYWNSVAQQLAEGLADNWSQVHLYCLFFVAQLSFRIPCYLPFSFISLLYSYSYYLFQYPSLLF